MSVRAGTLQSRYPRYLSSSNKTSTQTGFSRNLTIDTTESTLSIVDLASKLAFEDKNSPSAMRGTLNIRSSTPNKPYTVSVQSTAHLDFTPTDITEKKVSRMISPKSSVLVPISFFQRIWHQKLDFGGRKNEIFNKQTISTKKKQFRVVSSKKIELLKVQSSFLCTISGGQDSILTFFLLLLIYFLILFFL